MTACNKDKGERHGKDESKKKEKKNTSNKVFWKIIILEHIPIEHVISLCETNKRFKKVRTLFPEISNIFYLKYIL